MMVRYVGPQTLGGANDLKSPLLYFDRVEVQDRHILEFRPIELGPRPDGRFDAKGKVVGIHSTMSDEFRAQTKVLVDEGLLTIYPPEGPPPRISEIDLTTLYSGNLRYLLEPLSYDLAGNQSKIRILEQHVFEVHDWFFGPLRKNALWNQALLQTYYSGLLSDALDSIHNGHRVISSSRFVHNAIGQRLVAGSPTAQRAEEDRMACVLIQEAIVDLSSLDFSDILELRLRMTSEFEELQDAIASMSAELVGSRSVEELELRGKELAKRTIRPQLNAIERKMRGVRLSTAQKFMTRLRKPQSYVPLIATISWVPPMIALSFSLGLITLEAYLEHVRQYRETLGGGLSFLVQATERIRSKEAPIDTELLGEQVARADPTNLFTWAHRATKL